MPVSFFPLVILFLLLTRDIAKECTGSLDRLDITFRDALNSLQSTTKSFTATDITSNWQKLTIQLSSINAPPLITSIYVQNGRNAITLWLDDIALELNPNRTGLAKCADTTGGSGPDHSTNGAGTIFISLLALLLGASVY